MFQVRVHGRGGQGAVTAAELLSVAAFLDGREAQAIPSFGSERMGAPVVSYCRIDSAPIRMREPVTEPDAILVLDATLLHAVDVFGGLTSRGYVLINSNRTGAELGIVDTALDPERLVTVPASDIARALIGGPQVNVCLLGAFAAMTGCVSLAALEAAVRERFDGPVADRNLQAVEAAVGAIEASRHV